MGDRFGKSLSMLALMALGVLPIAGSASATRPIDAEPTSSAIEAYRTSLSNDPTARRAQRHTEGLGAAPLENIVTVVDTKGDASWATGDLLTAGVNAAATGSIGVGVTTALFDNPYSVNWQFGVTGIAWFFDVNGDQVEDYRAVLVNFEGDLSFGVLDSAGNVMCGGFWAYDPSINGYGGAFNATCIGSPKSFMWYAGMVYDDITTGIQSKDYAPDASFAGPVLIESPPAGSGSYAPLVPARFVETRAGGSTVDGAMNGIGVRGGGTVTAVQVAGRAGVPGDASAVVLNVTAVDAQAPGFVAVFPCGVDRPNGSNVNYVAGSTVANSVIAKIGSNGQVCVFTYATTDLLVDVNGYFP